MLKKDEKDYEKNKLNGKFNPETEKFFIKFYSCVRVERE